MKLLRLPKVIRSSVLVICYLVLVIGYFSPAAYAAGPPNPQPCKNPIVDELSLVDNYLLDSDGNPLPNLAFPISQVSGQDGDVIALPPQNFSFSVDFSKLQALFGGSNSNYLEGDFQNPEHLQTNVTALDSQNFNEYYKSLQKTTPKGVIDTQKVSYVKYINDHPGLPEASNKYKDIEGAGDLKTIFDLVNEYGIPSPPKPSQSTNAWNNTWGKYWPKIPTSYSEFYQGELAFHYIAGDYSLSIFKDPKNDKSNPDRGATCPPRAAQDTIKFVLPEFARTTQISDQLNRQMVAKCAQSYQQHGFLRSKTIENPECANNPTPTTSNKLANPLKSFFQYCWEILSSQSRNIINNFRESAPTSFKIPSLTELLVPVALAQGEEQNPSCIKILKDAKAGTAPYCPLPITEVARLGGAVSCSNKQSDLKLEKDNPNVVCTFSLTVTGASYVIDKNDPACTASGADYTCKNEDSCQTDPKSANHCKMLLYVIPNFRIPWLAAIWNNTLYSDRGDLNDPTQKTGRPGIYSFFTPRSIDEEITKAELNALFTECIQSKDLASKACGKLFDIYDELNKNDPTPDTDCLGGIGDNPSKLVGCFGSVIGQLDKSLPGTADKNTTNTAKERFIGATDCSQQFVRDVALKPKALQKAFNIQTECNLNESTANNGGGSNPGGPVVIPNCTDPNVTNPSDGNNSNGIETSRDQLICYIVQIASGKTEKLSGDPLPDVMIRVMNLESGGQQCAVSTYAALGVFQFVAGTWNEQPQASKPLDSGNGQGMTIGEINPGKTCWGITGPEPTATASGSNEYNWPIQSGGPNLDSGVWNPFWQIDATANIMQTTGGCKWTPYQSLYPDNCDGFRPAARFRI